MQNKLSPNQIDEIGAWYHDHPLLVTCRQAFGCYEADLKRLLFAPEELFLEAALVVDRILTAPTDAEAYISQLWNALKVKIRRWEPAAAPQEDLTKAVGAVFYVVAAVLCQHPQTFFNETLKDAVLSIVQQKMDAPSQEERRVIPDLARHAGRLDAWLASYKQGDDCLSADIVSVANGGISPQGLAQAGELAAQLAPIFFGDVAAAGNFLRTIRQAKPTQITALVRELVKTNVISEMSCHRDLWSILHAAGLYSPSESNWNQQLR